MRRLPQHGSRRRLAFATSSLLLLLSIYCYSAETTTTVDAFSPRPIPTHSRPVSSSDDKSSSVLLSERATRSLGTATTHVAVAARVQRPWVRTCCCLKAALEDPNDSNADSADNNDEEEWHPHDPAFTTPQLLVGLWDQIAMANSMKKGESMTVLYPAMQEELSKPRYLNLLLSHLDCCKDVCDQFGIRTSLVPLSDATGKVIGFTSKAHTDPKKDGEEYDFEYDPFWDDGTDFDALYTGIDDYYEKKEAQEKGLSIEKREYVEIVNKVPAADEEIVELTQKWVDTMMSNLGICPFSAGPTKAGLPVGNVHYQVDRAVHFEDVYAAYWKEVVRLERQPESEIATTLLVLPEFCMDQVEVFESFTNTLTQPLTALKVEDLLQLVFFHPHWSFRDGSARSMGQGQAANYARRSPWPMINLLRTSQVRAAQKGIPTGLVYKQNEKTLSSIGVDTLETMLRLRDWSDVSDIKVNRKEMDALKIAQEYQETGRVRKEDTSLEYDATPAAQKVDRAQVEDGDLVKVLMDALEKRLGKRESHNEQQSVKPLSGPETSATAMATDFLVQELLLIAKSGSDETKEPAVSADSSKTDSTLESSTSTTTVESAASTAAAPAAEAGAKPWFATKTESSVGAKTEEDSYDYPSEEPEELRRAKEEKMERAREAIFDDLRAAERQNKPVPDSGRSNPMSDILFGGSGIPETQDDDQLYPDGMNPENFF